MFPSILPIPSSLFCGVCAGALVLVTTLSACMQTSCASGSHARWQPITLFVLHSSMRHSGANVALLLCTCPVVHVALTPRHHATVLRLDRGRGAPVQRARAAATTVHCCSACAKFVTPASKLEHVFGGRRARTRTSLENPSSVYGGVRHRSTPAPRPCRRRIVARARVRPWKCSSPKLHTVHTGEGGTLFKQHGV